MKISKEYVTPRLKALRERCQGKKRAMVEIPHKVGRVTREFFLELEQQMHNPFIIADAIVAPPIHNTIRTCCSTIGLNNKSFLFNVVDNDCVFTLEDGRENFKAVAKLDNGKPHPVFADARSLKTADKEARRFFAAEKIVKDFKALAILVSLHTSKLLVSFFVKTDEQAVPTRLFTSEEEAVKWLRQFKD